MVCRQGIRRRHHHGAFVRSNQPNHAESPRVSSKPSEDIILAETHRRCSADEMLGSDGLTILFYSEHGDCMRIATRKHPQAEI